MITTQTVNNHNSTQNHEAVIYRSLHQVLSLFVISGRSFFAFKPVFFSRRSFTDHVLRWQKTSFVTLFMCTK